MNATRRATLLVGAAYVWWGLSAIFWRELDSVAPIDQISWRVLLGAAYLVLVWAFRRSNPMRSLTPRHVGYGAIAALVISANWVVFLWAIDNDQAVEASLGYFLMPLVSVALGVGLLGERLRRRQKAALLLGAIGAAWTLYVVGEVPWVAVVLGFSFAVYGWARKQGPWDVVSGLTFELLLIAPVVIVLLFVRGLDGQPQITGNGSTSTLLLIALTGLVTIVPLLLFASATKHVSLTVVGLLQYINPVLQFFVAWKIFGEDVSRARLIGFAWIWAALVLVVSDELSSKRPVDRRETGQGEGLVRS
jgi:chloramphenicol-sensitive protein RarD